MYPELWKIPGVGWTIKSYGFMLMCGFLVSIWIAMRRALRVKADPDLILNMGFVSLLFGVAGARLFYVAHYWKSSFASRPHPLWEAVNITAGGLEYYGGVIGATLAVIVYLRYFARFRAVGDDLSARATRRPSVRLYLDIVAPSMMLGLAFGRAGCFLNGCCWGGLCVHQENGKQVAALPWTVTFPFGSPAHYRQWENRQVAVPAELIFDLPVNPNAPFLLSPDSLRAPVEEMEGPRNRYFDLKTRLADAKQSDPKGGEVAALERALAVAKAGLEKAQEQHFTVYYAMQRPSRADPSRGMTRTELADLAAQYRSLPVHPAQLYALVNAVLLSLVISAWFYRRKRHGVVFAWMLVLYGCTRIVEELIRTDNPQDVGGLTISQAVSVGVLAVAAVALVALYRRMPLRSVRAIPAAPPPSPQGGK